MLYLIKVVIAAIIIVSVTEVSKVNAQLGGLIKSLPLISLISFIWLYYDTQNIKIIADLSLSTLLYVIPTLPMFYIFYILLTKGFGFHIALFLSVLTIIPVYILLTKILNS